MIDPYDPSLWILIRVEEKPCMREIYLGVDCSDDATFDPAHDFGQILTKDEENE